MNHSFDVTIAEQYDVDVAIFLNCIAFWIQQNIATKKNFHDGRYWTYNSAEAWKLLFPYWSTDKIDRLIKKCLQEDLMIQGNYNKSTYDRTRWLALSDKAAKLLNITIPQNCGIDSALARNLNRESAEPIPDNKPYIKPDKRESAKRASQVPTDFKPTEQHEQLAKEVGISITDELPKFIDYFLGTGKVQKDWNATFRNWIRKASEYKLNNKGAKNGNHRNETTTEFLKRTNSYMGWE